MKGKKLKNIVLEYFSDFSIAQQQSIFDFVFKRLKRMAEKNNLQGQKISKLREALAENGETYNAFLIEKNIKIEELSKCLDEEKTKRANDMVSLRSAMRSQTDTILALRDENEKLRISSDNLAIEGSNASIKKIAVEALIDRIVELEMQNKDLKEKLKFEKTVVDKGFECSHAILDKLKEKETRIIELQNLVKERENMCDMIRKDGDGIIAKLRNDFKKTGDSLASLQKQNEHLEFSLNICRNGNNNKSKEINLLEEKLNKVKEAVK